jgi:hypothetical protein
MYHMYAIRSILVSTLILAAVPPAMLRAASEKVQYVGGTVKSIPVNSYGSFNLDNPKELIFHYEDAVYRLPFDQITSTEIEKADVKHVLHVIPEESLMFTHRKRTLVINYKDASGVVGALDFELPSYQAVGVQEIVTARKTPPPAGVVESAWWGDKIWKTPRNQASWDAQAALNAQAAQAAQAQAAQAGQNAQNASAPQSGQLAPGGTK